MVLSGNSNGRVMVVGLNTKGGGVIERGCVFVVCAEVVSACDPSPTEVVHSHDGHGCDPRWVLAKPRNAHPCIVQCNLLPARVNARKHAQLLEGRVGVLL